MKKGVYFSYTPTAYLATRDRIFALMGMSLRVGATADET
jgi:hypothetical protein